MEMIRSKSNTFTFWLMYSCSIFFLFLAGALISKHYFHFTIIHFAVTNDAGVIHQLEFNLAASLFFGYQLFRDAKVITIDTVNKTIQFRNRFLFFSRTYDLSYFDGYIGCKQSSRSGTKRVLYLIKDERHVVKISGFYYSNLGELESNLKPLPYLGQKSFGIIKSILVLFNMRMT